MATLEIPEQFLVGVIKIRALDEKSVEEICVTLERESQSTTAPGKISSIVTRSISDTNIAQTLAALYIVKSLRDVTTVEFAEDVCAAVERQTADPSTLTPSERVQFKDKLVRLLNVKGLGIVAKAVDLQTDDEHIFCGARILTDLRPVFSANVSDGPEGIVIVHLLKLGYHQAGIDKPLEFYISLDADDLKAMRKAIDRAEEKASVLKTKISGIRYLGRS